MATMNQMDRLRDVQAAIEQVIDFLRSVPDIPATTGAESKADHLDAARRVLFDVRMELTAEIDPITPPASARTPV